MTAPNLNDPPRVTTDEDGEPTRTPVPKVIAATIGAGVGAAASTVIIYVLELTTGTDIPDVVEGAVSTLVTAGLAFAGGYLKRP